MVRDDDSLLSMHAESIGEGKTPMKSNNVVSFSERGFSAASIASFALLAALGIGMSGCNEAVAAETDSIEMEQRIEALETKEAIRESILEFAHIVDKADITALPSLKSKLHADFQLDVVDFEGHELHFVGFDGLTKEYGPIMLAAQANLAVSEIGVKLEGDTATASFKFINSVKPPPELGVPVNEKLLLLADNTAVFVRTAGVWQLRSMELVHSLAYPGELPAPPP